MAYHSITQWEVCPCGDSAEAWHARRPYACRRNKREVEIMTDTIKMSKKSGKIAEKLSTQAGEAFARLMARAGRKTSRLYGEKKGIKRLRA